MKAISYIYAVLNDYISCDDFVNWTFEAIEEGQIDAFDSDMIVKIQNCNCENKGQLSEKMEGREKSFSSEPGISIFLQRRSEKDGEQCLPYNWSQSSDFYSGTYRRRKNHVYHFSGSSRCWRRERGDDLLSYSQDYYKNSGSGSF